MILRIDDYPAGIRPIQSGQLETYDEMIREFAARGLQLHVGIVPVTYQRCGHKLQHPNIIACQHGFSHQYEMKSQELIRSGDLFNNRTIGIFNEFEGMRRRKVVDMIRAGREILEREFTKVDTYIPVCNWIDEELTGILQELGFKQILCERLALSHIPIIKSDYYGRLDEMDFSKDKQVITLHFSWEWDTINAKGWDHWRKLLDQLAKVYSKEVKKVVSRAVPKYKILFKYPIRERREKFFNTLDLYYSLMFGDQFTFQITIDEDDKVMNNREVIAKLKTYKNLIWDIAPCKSKIEAVNYGIRGDWDIVVLVSDDMIPKIRGYDDMIRQRMSENFPDLDGALWFNDGFQGNNINTLQIMGRKWYDRWGYIYHSDYVSQRCDYEFQLTALKWNRIKYFPEVIIRHEHADFGLALYDKVLLHNYTFIRRDEQVFYDRQKLGFPVKIPKIAHFIWSEGTPLTYLRFLTYQSFVEQNPDWVVRFHLVAGCGTRKNWKGREELEFMGKRGKDYLPKVAGIVNETVDGILPNYASDLIRWKALYEEGGFYLDLDQIILKPFDVFTDFDIVWGGRKINYSGVVGMFRRCPVAAKMYQMTKDKIEAGTENYCDAGNWLWNEYLATNKGDLKYYLALQTEQRVFYPIPESYMMKQYYDGGKPDLTDAYAMHWFGGHPDSQAFNRRTEKQINQTLKSWGI